MKKPPKQLWIVVNLHTREIPKVRGKYLLRESVLHPHNDTLPDGFPQRSGYSWEPVVETIVDPAHKGGPIFKQLDYQVARISKVIAPKGTE